MEKCKVNQHIGERLVMHQLKTHYNWDVEYVDYVGADLIAIDENNTRYAISVKTRVINQKLDESELITAFKYKDAAYLREFSADMSKIQNSSKMIPVVAYVVFLKDNSVFTFFINLNDLDDMRFEGSFVGLKEIKNEHGDIIEYAYAFKIGPQNLHQVLADDRVSYIEMKINSIKQNDLSRSHSENALHHNPELKKEHYSKQLGDFGEHLVVWQAKKNNMRALHIDTTGADVVLIDLDNKAKQYAVSVKTFEKVNRKSYHFEQSNVNKLKEFSQKWGMIPLVRLNFLVRDNGNNGSIFNKMYSFEFQLSYLEGKGLEDTFEFMRKANNGKGYKISFDDEHLKKIKENENIKFNVIRFE